MSDAYCSPIANSAHRRGRAIWQVSGLIGTAKRQPSPLAIRPADGGHHARVMSRDFGTSLLKRRFWMARSAYLSLLRVANGKECCPSCGGSECLDRVHSGCENWANL